MNNLHTKSSDDELMHYGIKGMKWGHRKARPEGGSGKPRKKKYSSAEIMDARQQMAAKGAALNAMQREAMMNPKYATKARNQQAQKLANEYLELSKVASKRTRGEKVATGLIAGSVGAFAISSLLG